LEGLRYKATADHERRVTLGIAMRKYRLPLILAALATFVIMAATVAFFVPTTVALVLVGVAAVLVAIGSVVLARRF
jgi:uncharacterized membrane-anchored protein